MAKTMKEASHDVFAVNDQQTAPIQISLPPDVTGALEEENEDSFWIQCETCKVWQHGQCVGYAKEELAPDHYHCEQCRPDLHVELLKCVMVSVPDMLSQSPLDE